MGGKERKGRQKREIRLDGAYTEEKSRATRRLHTMPFVRQATTRKQEPKEAPASLRKDTVFAMQRVCHSNEYEPPHKTDTQWISGGEETGEANDQE